jgi:hypothetical protein
LKPRDRWYVCIDHLTDGQLEFFGWYKVREGEEFVIYARAYGAEQQVIDKGGQKFLLVDDFNDAMQMKGSVVIQSPNTATFH